MESSSSSSSSSSSDSPYYYRIYSNIDHLPACEIDAESIAEDCFDLRIHVFQYIFPRDAGEPRTLRPYVPLFGDISIMPCDLLPHRFLPYLQQLLSDYLPSDEIQFMSSSVASYAQSMLKDADPNAAADLSAGVSQNCHRLLPLVLEILIPPEDVITNMVIEQSLDEQVTMIPASEEAFASLKKVEVMDYRLAGERYERCNVCLEDFEDDDHVSGMPCDHIYHNDCIVEWLKRSHMCPLCRFQMPA